MAMTAPFNKGRINPIYRVGGVNINTKIDAYDMQARAARAENTDFMSGLFGGSAKAYYGLPRGQFGNTYRVVNENEIVFRNKAFTKQHFAGMTSANQQFSSNVSLEISTTLNGLGDNDVETETEDEKAELVMQNLQVIGLALTTNSLNNETNITASIGGTGTRCHDGQNPLMPGDWVISTAPLLSAVLNGQGGSDNQADEQGLRITMRGEPYDSAIHTYTPKFVYRALILFEKDRIRAKHIYLHSYLTSALALYKSICQIGATTLIALRDDIGIEAKNVLFADAIKSLLNKNPPDAVKARNMRSKLRDHVFAAYLPKVRRDTLFKNNENHVSAAEGIGLAMRSIADHVKVVLERVICKTLAGAVSKADYDFQMICPAR